LSPKKTSTETKKPAPAAAQSKKLHDDEADVHLFGTVNASDLDDDDEDDDEDEDEDDDDIAPVFK